jgi:MraZ protein
MFIGEYEVSLGDKNRLALPKKLREMFSGKIYLTRGYERCLIIVDSERWERLVSEINKNPLLTLGVRDTKRYLLGGALEVESDSQGRFILPESLKVFAGINAKVTFLGVGEWCEIWSNEKWLEKLDELGKNVSDLAERLTNEK